MSELLEIETPNAARVRYRYHTAYPDGETAEIIIGIAPDFSYLFTEEDWEFVRQAIWHPAPSYELPAGTWLP